MDPVSGASGATERLITVVTGLPRSGTSLAMQWLEAAGIPPFTDGRRLADVSNPWGYYEADIVQTLPVSTDWLERAEGCALKVIHHLLPHLPGDRPCRVLVMERDLSAVLRSQRLMLERLGRPGANLPEEAMKRAYGAQLAAMEAWLERLPPERVHRQRFEAALEDPLEAAEGLLGWLGLSGEESLRRGVAAVVRPS